MRHPSRPCCAFILKGEWARSATPRRSGSRQPQSASRSLATDAPHIKTSYNNILRRYRESRLKTLTNRSRRLLPSSHSACLPGREPDRAAEEEAPRDMPKIRERLRTLSPELCPSTIGTMHAVLDRWLRQPPKPRSHHAQGTVHVQVLDANKLCCADYKGELMLAV
jgi:putative transposase